MAGGALPGFRAFYPDEFARRVHLFRAWREVCRRYAFVEYDGPPLEPLELYTKKSGDEIVRQLYAFTDKGGREVALRPEMTPTFARMVAAKAQALRKPIRWFSIPQLFRYERQQKGRLREHFQLNVDIVGESSETADAEVLAVALDIMRELGLTPADVRARVSDRRLLNALLDAVGVRDTQREAVYAVLDKSARQPLSASRDKLAEAGLTPASITRVMALPDVRDAGELRREFGKAKTVAPHLDHLDRYLGHLESLDVRGWVDLDLAVVRGLAYYTGIVFELFDAQGELRAICGGGRYDNLLKELGGVDLPACGFGMGDVVLGKLVEARGKFPTVANRLDFYVVESGAEPMPRARMVSARLRRLGYSVECALREQPVAKQLKAASSAGAARAVLLLPEGHAVLKDLASGREQPFAIEAVPPRHPD